MNKRLFALAYLAVSVSIAVADQSNPEVLTYGHNRDVPLPYMVGGSDLAFVDWNGDGLKDVLMSPNGGRLLLRLNIGTPTTPRYENVYEKNHLAIEDQRIGRFFALMEKSGLKQTGGNLPAIVCFEKHAGIKEISVKDLPLNLFIPKRDGNEIRWEVIEARWPDGSILETLADSWMCPNISVVDWDADGREDLLIGGWHPSIAQPNGKYTAGYKHPADSWNPMAGRVYVMRNVSDGKHFMFEKPALVQADGKDIVTYGFVYPQAQDIDGDGLFDLVVGEERPGLRWYQNVGSEGKPKFNYAGMLSDTLGDPIYSDLSVRAYFVDLDNDNKPEMITTSYFAFTMGLLRFNHVREGENFSTGWEYDGMLPMKGGKDTPVSAQGICTVEVTDWNGDGVRDLLLGSEPGTPMILINEGTDLKPVWQIPQRIKNVDGEPLEYYGIEIGRGSVWGPIEFYLERTLPRMVDWNNDGVEDIVTGSMAARLVWLPGRMVDGERRFEKPHVMKLNGEAFDVAHRVQPVVRDFNGDGHMDIVALDTQNVVTLWYGNSDDELHDPRPFYGPDDKPLQLNPAILSVTSGRRGLGMIDWDLDGGLDLVTYNAFGPTVWGGEIRLHLADTSKPMHFREAIPLHKIISHHNGGVTFVDWDKDGYMDIIIGGDHTHLNYHAHPRGQFFVLNGRDLPVPPARR